MIDHFYQSIEGMFRWTELYSRAVREAPDQAVFVEIGCFKGKSTAFLAVEAVNSGKYITIHAVDLWDTSRKIGCEVSEFMANVGFLGVNPIKMDSVEASKIFPDNSLDFVWIDGNHTYPHVSADIKSWWKKLKPGGWMGGDDLIHGGVRRAVEEFFGKECSERNPSGEWIRFQSPEVFHRDSDGISPTAGGLVWWTSPKRTVSK